MSKSSTHQKVVKNGQEGWIVKEVWTDMVKAKDTNGFSAVASAPPEVELIKKTTKPVVEEAEGTVDPVLTGDTKAKKK